MTFPSRDRATADWKLERYVLGELPPEEMDKIRQAAQDNPALRARLDALNASDREILDRYPTGWATRQIREKTIILN